MSGGLISSIVPIQCLDLSQLYACMQLNCPDSREIQMHIGKQFCCVAEKSAAHEATICLSWSPAYRK